MTSAVRGRPRSPACDLAIEAATVELLVEDGFAGLSIEKVAARAGVGKATIYRRWETKEALVVDAVHHRCAEDFEMPSTDSARADLLEMLRHFVTRVRRDGPLMQAFAAERGRHPELAETFRRTFLAGRRAAAREIIRRGIAAGEFSADTDVEVLADAGPALIWHRLTVTGDPLEDDLPERILRQFAPIP